MVRNRKPKPEGKLRQRFSDEKLNETIQKIQKKEWSVREAERFSGIPKRHFYVTWSELIRLVSFFIFIEREVAIIFFRILVGINLPVLFLSDDADSSIPQPVQRKKLGRRFALSEVEERVLVRILEKISEWGFPLETDEIRTVVMMNKCLNMLRRKKLVILMKIEMNKLLNILRRKKLVSTQYLSAYLPTTWNIVSYLSLIF